jgi:hypothetical protein
MERENLTITGNEHFPTFVLKYTLSALEYYSTQPLHYMIHFHLQTTQQAYPLQ